MTEKKIRPGRITDEQVEAFGQAVNKAADESGAELCITDSVIRAGLIAAYTRRELENRTTPTLHPINLDPYPGTVSEVADEIARFVLELESAGIARGVAGMVLDRIRDARRMDVVERKVCKVENHRDGRDAATVRVRYQYANEGVQRWTVDMCDRHGTLTYERYVREGKRNVEIMPAGWTPESDCTPVRDRTVHPDENRVHNLDGIKGAPKIVAREVDVFPDGNYCRACDLGLHLCPGCGRDIPHGTVACSRRCS